MKIEIFDKGDKNKILSRLKEQFGVEKLNFLLVRSSKDKIRGYTGHLSKVELLKLTGELYTEGLGLYMFKVHDDGLRLSIDACHALKEEIKENIIELNEDQTIAWFKGNDLEFENKDEYGYKILKYKGDLIGCGKLSQGRLVNFVPKERRIKGN